ncbi:MAG: (d)CMP kinase [Bacteroidales bacterium]|nr:(d)CMP kinase [Bacteroidales bacterium]MBN2755768.1 (d)CMP kinase [Bacteroidales bacterium]
MKDIIIAFDGYSSCGKSTLAKQIANFFDFIYIDSGAMYRAVTLFAMQNNLIVNSDIDIEKLRNALNNIQIKFIYNQNLKKQETFLNGQNVENEIRNISVSDKVSYISEIDFVREKLVDLQQKMGPKKRIVMDGRDIGTVVFPSAELKIFMTASSDVRAKRRYDELIAKGDNVSFEEVKENIEKRDYIDENREISPLKKADDAIVLDNSILTREEQFDFVKGLIANKFSL